MSKHTPDWQSQHDFDVAGLVHVIGNVDGEILHDGPRYTFDTVCTVDEENPDWRANLKLILAAPDLLAALRAVSHTLDVHGHIDSETDLHEMVHAALAQASGQ